MIRDFAENPENKRLFFNCFKLYIINRSAEKVKLDYNIVLNISDILNYNTVNAIPERILLYRFTSSL